MPSLPGWLAVAWLVAVSAAIAATGRREGGTPERRLSLAAQLLLLVVALVTPDGRVAYAAVAAAGALLAWSARRTSWTAAAYLALATALALVAAATVGESGSAVALVASLVALALRAGVFPLHAGVAALGEDTSPRQVEQLAALPVLVFVHLRFVDHGPLAYELARPIVWIGGISTLLFALVSLAQRDLRRLYVASTLMHGGMVFSAVGAAGRGHYAAALLVVVTMSLALAGFSAMLAGFEARVGEGRVPDFVGRARAFPRLAAALAIFGGAAVGLPGTAGFVADDLLLHALWEESVWTAVTVIVSSALLAVATLATFARVFFGPPQRHLAPDLLAGERRVAVLLLLMLVSLGFFPSVLVSPVNALLR